ncbi:hypothetical protein [Halomicrobium mukohataei]|uniref:Uncharacterized protein n=2 Tax=Halomicrobium mukohataei TaxID=57705 RepID=C7P551_HALMD|nr:hypothetical protein [Halomicrobium mukohataei]ACV49446.1 hypothetical protein Hmuk_3360 [Halomicrobium mukohataei DSM 12286]QCD67269.1 hypothetical protein E5139_16660 [Halomicrobium mukohataei]
MLEDEARSVIAIPQEQTEYGLSQVTELLKESTENKVIEVQRDAFHGKHEVFFSVGDVIMSILVIDGHKIEHYPGYCLIEFTNNNVRDLENTSDFLNTDHMDIMVATATDLYDRLTELPKVGFGIETYQSEGIPISGESFPPADRDFLTWFDIFSPAEVEAIGRETLLSAPAPRVEALEDGSILLISKNPVDNAPPEEVSEHVGIQTMTDYSDHVSRSEFYDE